MILILWLLYLWKWIIAKNWIAFFPQHTLPSFALPAEKDGTVYPLPSVVYRMFDYTDVPEVSLLMQSWLLQRVVAYSSLCILPLERVIVHRHYWGNNTPYKMLLLNIWLGILLQLRTRLLISVIFECH